MGPLQRGHVKKINFCCGSCRSFGVQILLQCSIRHSLQPGALQGTVTPLAKIDANSTHSVVQHRTRLSTDLSPLSVAGYNYNSDWTPLVGTLARRNGS